MKKTQIILLFIIPLFYSGCEPICDCFKGQGGLTTEERNLPEITSVKVYNDVDVIIHVDTVFRMRVTAGSKLIDEITTKVDGQRLTIRNENNCNWVRKYKPTLQVTLWVKSLSDIEFEDATGNLEVQDTIKVPEFLFQSFASSGDYHLKIEAGTATLSVHNGSSNFYAEGKVNVNYAFTGGFGKMDCLNLQTDDTYLNNKGTNDLTVYARNVLGATIMASGNVYYKGNPQITSTITGKGKLIPLQ